MSFHKDYMRRHHLPQIYEALLCGMLIRCPEDPLKFLEERIKKLIEIGFDTTLWDCHSDSSAHPKLKRLSENLLEQLFGTDDGQLVTPALYKRAHHFHTGNVKRRFFGAWKEYLLTKKREEKLENEKIALSASHYNQRLLRSVVLKWNAFVKGRKQCIVEASRKLQKVVKREKISKIIRVWHKETQCSKKAKDLKKLERRVMENQLKEDDSEGSEKPEVEVAPQKDLSSPRDRMAQLPEAAVIQVFKYLNIVDLASCAQVNRSWMLMTQVNAVWSIIDFSSVKSIVEDKVVVNILRKWRPSVVRLNLRGCSSLQWPSFKCIGECKNLQELNVSECQGLNDESMRLISEGCQGLLYLNLAYTDITNGTIRLLARSFPHLQYLSLAFCRRFTDHGLRYLASGRGCSRLSYLDLSGCVQITVQGFEYIGAKCRIIQHLTINDLPTLSDSCVKALAGNCQQITSLILSGTPALTDVAFQALSECKLVKIRVEGSNWITDVCFKIIQKYWPNISHIHIADCQRITDSSLKAISTLKKLRVLNLSCCTRISDTGVRHFFDGHSSPKIRELNLTHCNRISDASLLKISQRCQNLNYLSLRYCDQLTDSGIESLGHLSSLFSIDLSGTTISDSGLAALSQRGQIKQLTVSECKNITDLGIQMFCENTTALDYLDVSYCLQLSCEMVKNVAICCHRLTALNIAGCPRVTDIGLQFLSENCRYLHSLDISGCIHLSDKTIKALWKGCKGLRILKMLYCRHISKAAASKLSNRVRQQEYNTEDPPPWLGYDAEGNPLFPSTPPKAPKPPAGRGAPSHHRKKIP
ncbi:dynein regulatory complex subunit 6 isoform X2 [Tachyglossus aculeatus]|uniref:dynein regulatory complex subunit 6 isoform X2 n=1 Tax=Tachyglossus aculeatus TaxID=9261 RepID=UPI0018F4C395|nr:dynein regulatory complex subunit 6 isoform X2 [Tachyglossus aculeatus]